MVMPHHQDGVLSLITIALFSPAAAHVVMERQSCLRETPNGERGKVTATLIGVLGKEIKQGKNK